MDNSSEFTKNDFERLLEIADYNDFSAEEALTHLGMIIDGSLDFKNIQGLERSLILGQELLSKEMRSDQVATAHYFLANANISLDQLNTKASSSKKSA